MKRKKPGNVKTVSFSKTARIVDHSSVFLVFSTFLGFCLKSGFRDGCISQPTVKREMCRKVRNPPKPALKQGINPGRGEEGHKTNSETGINLRGEETRS